MLIQPLVENAVLHMGWRQKGGGRNGACGCKTGKGAEETVNLQVRMTDAGYLKEKAEGELKWAMECFDREKRCSRTAGRNGF